jgi:hypothetical protein
MSFFKPFDLQFVFISLYFKGIALGTFIKTNQNQNSERRREAPPLTILVLFPNKNCDRYNREQS